jgi:hypothetical protein
MEQLHYNDVMADLASIMEQAGTRKFLSDFQENFPKHFHEMQVQMNRTDQQRRLPRLLDKNAPTV